MRKIRGSNANMIKQNNRALLLNIIKQTGGISRAELSKITGLSKGGITPIIGDLLKLKLIVETGVTKTESGRRPIILELNPSGCYALAVDLTRKNILAAIVDFKGNIVSTAEYQYAPNETLDNMIANLKRIVALLMARDEGKKVVGIGVVAPGPLDDRKGVILSPQNFYGWSNIPIGDILKESVHLPVFLDNNANAYALAEKNYGKGRNYHSFLHMVIDEGIGTGIIVNDKIYKGKGGFGSETGHISIQMDGPKCECGSNGCLEVYATIPRIMDALNTSAELGVPSEFLSGIIKNRPLEWEDIIEGLNRKDAVCINILKKEASYLGCALVNLINVLEPEAVILGSKIAQAGSFITVPLREYVEERTVTREFQKPDIFVSNLAKASLLGGATIVLNHFIEGTMGEYEEILKSVG